METFDSAKAARVWQRVRGEEEEPNRQQGLLQLISEEQSDATQYLVLSRQFRGKQTSLLQKMHEKARASAAALRGIYYLLTGEHPASTVLPPHQRNREAVLRRCYVGSVQRLGEYEARSADPEHGCVYAKLAADTQEQCFRILILLGKEPSEN